MAKEVIKEHKFQFVELFAMLVVRPFTYAGNRDSLLDSDATNLWERITWNNEGLWI